MSETLLAVIIGGAIAVIGSASTQFLLFWLNGRKEKQNRRRLAIEYATKASIELQRELEGMNSERKKKRKDLDEIIALSIKKVDGYSDDEISGVIAISQWVAEGRWLARNR